MPQLNIDQALKTAAHHNAAEQLPQAQSVCEGVLREQPENADALHLLGIITAKLGRHQAATELIQRAIARRPNWPQAHYHLGNVWLIAGNLSEAINSYRRAIDLKPDYIKAFNNLGVALEKSGKKNEAMLAFERALALDPTDAIARLHLAAAHNNRGTALEEKGQLDEAAAGYSAAIAMNSEFAEAHYNLGNVLKNTGQIRDSVAAYRQAIAIKPGFVEAHNNLVYAMHFDPVCDALAIAGELRRWNDRHALPLKQFIQPWLNDRDPNRRLRIGYVSPDFKEHPVGRFLLPVLAQHDRNQFEIFAYSQVPISDAMTCELQSHTDTWREIANLTDAQVADLIRRDGIDILIDLTMHMARNRLLVFARKPAPVQVTWLAYCSSTGLDTMDYRLSDPWLDPQGVNDSIYSEKTIRLPETYWCYQPISGAMESTRQMIQEPPAKAAGHITFGCLNHFAKVSQPALATWTTLLKSVPGSHLLLHAPNGTHRQKLLDQFQRDGIDPDRLRFAGKLPVRQYLALYKDIDIALDPCPYGGGTTTCDALWMGVPVVSLAGKTAVGRGGQSILSNIGLPELAANTQQRYIEIAMELAGDIPRLTHLRSTLRDRMMNSPLMDAPRFARNIEKAYRHIWQGWCAANR